MKKVFEMSREYRFTFTENINLATALAFEKKVCGIIGEKDFSKLTILFSSDGGSTDLALSLNNFIKQLPQAIHMHAIGHVVSSAIPVFLAANKRTAEPNSRFFFHTCGWNFGGGYQFLHTINESV
ncbi:MAG: ATP-dependent Clp protease proteolytic subunit [Paracoccaceae bacterium]|nr:ATP-dependent Clp protease proteolytic subunit [Paracoccaceae bacterium]MDE2915861.1 ATP-dependent Clp protease proteolytic subunit [Paracoccaceae bacterium]